MKPAKTKPAAAVLLACSFLAACGGSPTTQASPSAPASPAPATSGAVPSSAPGGSTQVKKVSANTASEAEIAEALRAAGVPNPERWAEEVVEYRPYAADDPDLTSLRENLAKYNPGEETVDKIVSALTP
ncbi:hypothetical protein [Streptosporangium carneum]|uniref:Lipoprotein n=1 Tax=Streptosporangium carneum TaxID=47481 RepID=A0A9W6I5A8_9ACTN|nr:hypothetical protein [Streptosporangium carneum]GLK11474.1 hypothetical protein GCM10017600_48810 [Streptosporangium carneum]